MYPSTREELAAMVVAELRKIFGYYPTDLPTDELEEEAGYWDPFGIRVAPDEMPAFLDFVQAKLVAGAESEKTKEQTK